MKIKIIFLLLSLSLVCVFSACSVKETSSQYKDNGTVDYSTKHPMSATDYSTYINTEALTFYNQLTARMDMGLSVAKCIYPTEDELKNIEASMKVLEDTIENITVTNPPAVYKDTREDILRVMANGKSSLGTYKEAVEDGSVAKIEAAIQLMKNDAISVTAFIGLHYN